VCHVGIKRDAAVHRAERALRESEDRFRRVAATVPGVVYQFEIRPDGSRHFPFISEGVRALFGLEADQLVGDARRAFSLIHPDDLPRFLADVQRAAAARAPFRQEMRLVLPNGTRWVHAAAAGPDVTADGALLWSGFVIDVTDRRTVEDQLKQAKELAEAATRAKSLLLANTSHELRTPLNAVVGMCDLLLAGRLEPAQRESAEVIRASAAHLQALIDDLLDVSTIEAGRLELERRPFDLRRCVRSALDQVATRAAEKGLPLTSRVADGVAAAVSGAAPRLRQVLVNLLGNAVKFTDAGEVRLDVEPVEVSPGLPSGQAAPAPALRLSVHDTGIGIPQERLDLLFRPFSQVDPSATRRHGGTGLGLAICQRLVALMGGRIEVETAPQRGSTFRVLLPLDATGPLPARAPACAARSLSVLIVEDNAVNRAVSLRLLASLGHVGEVAATGAEALLCLERRAFDVVLMDVQMPGMDGHEATRRIAARFPRERRPWVVAMTASAFPGDRERCLEAGMDDYVSKPVGLAELERALTRAGGGAPPEAPRAAAPDAPQAVDGTNLAVLRVGPDGDAAVAELIDLFLEDLDPSVAAIRAAIAQASAQRLVGSAHALKGSCGSLGAGALGKVVALLEAAGRAGDLAAAERLLPDLDQERARARAALLALRPSI
jgi:PAS domain S-box-containing protein